MRNLVRSKFLDAVSNIHKVLCSSVRGFRSSIEWAQFRYLNETLFPGLFLVISLSGPTGLLLQISACPTRSGPGQIYFALLPIFFSFFIGLPYSINIFSLCFECGKRDDIQIIVLVSFCFTNLAPGQRNLL